MDFYPPVSNFCQYQGCTSSKAFQVVDSLADFSFAGESSAGTRVGLGLGIITDPWRRSRRWIFKTYGPNGFFGTAAFRDASRKNSLWILDPLQLGRTDIFIRRYVGFKVDMGWRSAPVRLHSLASRSQKIRHDICVNLAAIQPGTEPAASVDDRENGTNRRHTKDSNDPRGEPTGKWNIESDEELLRLIEESRDSYPMVRTFKNDLCTLEICGCALRSQVLAAMASDQSLTAATNILMGRGLTVLQSVLPGTSGEHNTVATKLFAPSLLVAEKAWRSSPPNGMPGREFMRRLFEAVQLQKLSKFYVEFHAPGTVRNMSALEHEEMVQIAFSFEASNQNVLEQLGKTIALYAIGIVKENGGGRTFAGLFGKIGRKSKWIPSQQSPVRIRTLSVEEIQSYTNMLPPGPIRSSEQASTERRTDRSWLPVPGSLLMLIRRNSNHAIERWIHEHVPMHQLHLDSSLLDVKITGQCNSSGQMEEILLTHAQLVDFAGVFDQFYEDRFTLLDKALQTRAVLDFQHVSRSKVGKFLETTAISSLLVGAGLFVWLVAARMRGSSGISNDKVASKFISTGPVLTGESFQFAIKDEPVLPVNEQIPVNEMDALCKLAVSKIAEAFDWDGEIQVGLGKGAWIGKQYTEPNVLQKGSQADGFSENSSVSVLENKNAFSETRMDAMASSEHEDEGHEPQAAKNEKVQMATVQRRRAPFLYQVVLSRDGDVLGFQPLNRDAVALWAIMPFADLLHKGQKLGPGFWEPQLKYNKPPKNAVVLELCISTDPLSPFVTARPFPMK